ncbi:MAG: transcriptional repressor [Rhodospirillaceae bacterium]|nr:transcriptional repressor [Rhodospirillaceae bacterium]|tara:strand:- start:25 stop:432 length:408 start_codon:yes stop_codon:yes gene_type:complete
MATDLIRRCIGAGLKMTGQRRIILQIIDEADDHPSVDIVHQRARSVDGTISIATVYRTLNVLDELNLVRRHEFNDKLSRFETNLDQHHHVIDVDGGDVREFTDSRLETLIEDIASELGYDLIDHKLELYGRRKDK